MSSLANLPEVYRTGIVTKSITTNRPGIQDKARPTSQEGLTRYPARSILAHITQQGKSAMSVPYPVR